MLICICFISIGVIAIICPNDFPLLSFVSLVGAAVARANAAVVVPSQKCPVPALDMYQVSHSGDLRSTGKMGEFFVCFL